MRMIARTRGSRSGQRALHVGVAAATASLLLGACGSGPTSGEAFASIRSGNDIASRERVYDSWTDLLAMSRTGKPLQDAVAATIVGEVAGVQEGRSFLWELDDEGEEKRVETTFGADNAMVSTYHLAVNVSAVIGTDIDTIQRGGKVTVGIAVDPDVSLGEVTKDFGDIKRAVFFLQQSPVFDYEDRLYAIVEDGALMAVPDKNGNLSFPLLDASDPIQPPGGVTAADLKSD